MKHIFYKILIIFLVCENLFAQTADEVILKMGDSYSTNKCVSYSLKYNLYKDENSSKIYDGYNGIYKKNESNSIYQKIKNTEFILKDKVLVKVMHDDKTITVSKVTPFSMGDNTIKSLMQYCSISNFKQLKAGWQIILIPKQNSELEYSKIIIFIDTDFRISWQKFYYNIEIDFSKNFQKRDGSKPVLEIVYSNYNNNKIENSIYNLKKYIDFKGNKMAPSLAYSKYILEDYR